MFMAERIFATFGLTETEVSEQLYYYFCPDPWLKFPDCPVEGRPPDACQGDAREVVFFVVLMDTLNSVCPQSNRLCRQTLFKDGSR
jgi:hypothetical protein